MQNIIEALKSKKFKAFLYAEIVILLPALAGKVSWQETVMAIASIAAAYMLGQSYVDGKASSNY
jgi:hypothetical protein